jgi:hypothetical protein
MHLYDAHVTLIDEWLAAHLLWICWLYPAVMLSVVVWLVGNHQWSWICVIVACTLVVNRLESPTIRPFREWFSSSIGSACGGVKVVGISKAAAQKPVMYGIHPHGILACGVGFASISIGLRNERVALIVAPFLRWVNPLFRVFTGACGYEVLSSTPREMTRIMAKNNTSVAIVVGGFDEMLMDSTDEDLLFLRNRKGFVKMAITHGYDLVPVYVFGETQLYRNILRLPNCLVKFCMRWMIPLLFPVGKWWYPLIPDRLEKGLKIVFGGTMNIEKNPNPTRELITSVHDEYIKKVEAMYKQHNPYPNRKLKIF